MEDDEAIREFESIFKEKKCSLSSMVKYLQGAKLMAVRERPNVQPVGESSDI